MKLENVKIDVKVQVKDGAPNTSGLYEQQNCFNGKIGVIVDIDYECSYGLTARVEMSDGTKLSISDAIPWFSHKDLRIVKEEVK